MPAAVVVLLGVVLQFRAHVTGISLVPFAALVVVACGLLTMQWTHSRLLARSVVTVVVIAAVIPEVPLRASALSRVASNVLTAVHVLGAITWVGGLVVLAATGIAMRRSTVPAEHRERIATDWAQIWERFSSVAMIAVGALIVSGTWLAWSHVGTPSQLLTTPYGRFLAVKLLLVLVLLGAGGYNVRILLPRIGALQRDGDAGGVFRLAVQHFPAVVFGEALLAICVLAVVPFLRGTARTEAGWPNAAPFDVSAFGTGVVLIAVIAAAMWVGTRRSFRRVEPSMPTP